MSRRSRRGRRRPKAAEVLLSALVIGGVLYGCVAAFTAIHGDLAAMLGTFAMGVIVGHSLPSVRVIWRRR